MAAQLDAASDGPSTHPDTVETQEKVEEETPVTRS